MHLKISKYDERGKCYPTTDEVGEALEGLVSGSAVLDPENPAPTVGALDARGPV